MGGPTPRPLHNCARARSNACPAAYGTKGRIGEGGGGGREECCETWSQSDNVSGSEASGLWKENENCKAYAEAGTARGQVRVAYI